MLHFLGLMVVCMCGALIVDDLIDDIFALIKWLSINVYLVARCIVELLWELLRDIFQTFLEYTRKLIKIIRNKDKRKQIIHDVIKWYKMDVRKFTLKWSKILAKVVACIVIWWLGAWLLGQVVYKIICYMEA